MKTELFRGVGTALVTPLRDGKIDYTSLEWLIDRQAAAGVEALVIGGTTGESATLSDDERYDLFREARRMTYGRCKLIFGTGTNSTESTLKYTQMAEAIGCDGVMIVTPYYNKGTRIGVQKHYETVAKSANLPIMLYNVPSRTGVDLEIGTIKELSKIDNISAIKEAGTISESRMRDLSEIDGLGVYAGNDKDVLRVMDSGGLGVISVVSNLYPEDMHALTSAYLCGRREEASAILNTLLPLVNALFLDTNPAPLKYALALLGLCSGEMRLPMYEVDDDVKKRVRDALFTFEAQRGA